DQCDSDASALVARCDSTGSNLVARCVFRRLRASAVPPLSIPGGARRALSAACCGPSPLRRAK
ncbi:MAG: hypothetical protein ACK56F_26200, partial [bacterium]